MNTLSQSIEQSNHYLLLAYYIYLPVSMALTWYVAHRLFRNSLVFMNDIFHGKLEIATSTNRLFEMGFYLFNIGFALLILKINYLESAQDLFERLSYKIGGFAVYLGIMLFLNLYLFFRGRRKSRENLNHSKQFNFPSAE